MRERLPAEERRRQIVEAAAELFARKGFQGTTTREIAEAVGGSEAMIFKYFPTKEELYSAIIEAKAKTDEILAATAQAATAKDDAGVFQAIGRSMIETTEADPTLMRLLLFSALEGHELSEMFFESRVRRLHEFLSAYIHQRIADGEFKEVDPLVTARGFVGMVVHYLLIHEVFGVKRPPRSSPEEVVSTFVNVFLKGLKRGR